MATQKTTPTQQPTRYGELVHHTVANGKSGVAQDLEQSAKSRVQYNK